jgi:hypothetical protein
LTIVARDAAIRPARRAAGRARNADVVFAAVSGRRARTRRALDRHLAEACAERHRG